MAVGFFKRNTSFIFYVLAMAVIALLDFFSGKYFSFWFFYLLPISFAAWNLGAKAVWPLVGLSVLLLSAVDFFIGTPYPNLFFTLFALASKIGSFSLLVVSILALRTDPIERVAVPPYGHEDSLKNSHKDADN